MDNRLSQSEVPLMERLESRIEVLEANSTRLTNSFAHLSATVEANFNGLTSALQQLTVALERGELSSD